MKQALSFRLTSIHDADTKPAHIALFQKLTDAGKLPVRADSTKAKLNVVEQALPRVKQRLSRYTLPQLINYRKHARLNLRSVKLIADCPFLLSSGVKTWC